MDIISLSDIGCTDELPETTGTIAGNSKQKATYVLEKFGVDCIADDSGLEVEALNGAPGVDSAFYAGPEKNFAKNCELLLTNLKGVNNRNARFVTIITLARPNSTIQFEGVVNGVITDQPKGDQGFGYDPIFLPSGFDKTLAQMSLAEKNAISHRGKAVQALVRFLSGQ